jgi:hypothetical protein
MLCRIIIDPAYVTLRNVPVWEIISSFFLAWLGSGGSCLAGFGQKETFYDTTNDKVARWCIGGGHRRGSRVSLEASAFAL